MALASAFERLERWMRVHGAPLLADNLADGAPASRIADAEAELGFPLPPALGELWSLHDGQREELDGFVGTLDLFGAAWALAAQDDVARALDLVRQHPEDWEEEGVTEAEVRSERWVAFAGRDDGLLLASGETGRVFMYQKDVPPLALVAPSITAFFETYAEQVEGGEFGIEEGFGTYFLHRPSNLF